MKFKNWLKLTYMVFIFTGFSIIFTYAISESRKDNNTLKKINTFKTGGILLCMDNEKENIHVVIKDKWLLDGNKFSSKENDSKVKNIIFAKDCVEVK